MSADDQFVQIGGLLSGEPVETQVVQDEQVRGEEGAEGALRRVVHPGLGHAPEEVIGMAETYGVTGADGGIAQGLGQEGLADTGGTHQQEVLVPGEEPQGEGGIQEPSVQGAGSGPVEVLQPAGLLEASGAQPQFQAAVGAALEWPNVPGYSHSFIPPRVVPPSGSIICEATIPSSPSSVTLSMSQFGVLRPRYPMAYNMVMVEIRQTDAYARWFRRLRDRQARVRIDSRIRRLSLGNTGDVRPVGEGVSEIRIDYGPGYRVYFVQRGEALVVLLAGGDKDSQDRDIRRALDLARGL